MDESEPVGGQLVVSGGDSATVFDLVEEPFDQVAGSMEIWAEADGLAA
jgi:hypothetical protein